VYAQVRGRMREADNSLLDYETSRTFLWANGVAYQGKTKGWFCRQGVRDLTGGIWYIKRTQPKSGSTANVPHTAPISVPRPWYISWQRSAGQIVSINMPGQLPSIHRWPKLHAFTFYRWLRLLYPDPLCLFVSFWHAGVRFRVVSKLALFLK
jgi:hypothetical protein